MSQSTSTTDDTLAHDLAQGILSEMGRTSRAIQETHEAVSENMAHCTWSCSGRSLPTPAPATSPSASPPPRSGWTSWLTPASAEWAPSTLR